MENKIITKLNEQEHLKDVWKDLSPTATAISCNS